MTSLANFVPSFSPTTPKDATERLETLLVQISGLAGCVELIGDSLGASEGSQCAVSTLGWVLRDLVDQASEALQELAAEEGTTS